MNAGQTSVPKASVAAAANTRTVAAAKAKQRHRRATIKRQRHDDAKLRLVGEATQADARQSRAAIEPHRGAAEESRAQKSVLAKAGIDHHRGIAEEHHPDRHAFAQTFRQQRAQRSDVTGQRRHQPDAQRGKITEQREGGAQQQKERRIEKRQIAPAGIVMQLELQRKVRQLGISLRGVPLQHQLPGGPEAGEVAG